MQTFDWLNLPERMMNRGWVVIGNPQVWVDLKKTIDGKTYIISLPWDMCYYRMRPSGKIRAIVFDAKSEEGIVSPYFEYQAQKPNEKKLAQFRAWLLNVYDL
jgi:hypothetical protein